MNKKIVLLILLAVSVMLMSGITYSFFTDSSFAGEVVFMTGSNEVEIVENSTLNITDAMMAVSTSSVADDDYGNWKPGEENGMVVNWRFKNAGDQDSLLKVEIDAGWDGDANNTVHWVQTSNVNWNEEWIEEGFVKLEYSYPEIVRPGEEVELSFKIWFESIIGVEDTDYAIDLEVESYQVH